MSKLKEKVKINNQLIIGILIGVISAIIVETVKEIYISNKEENLKKKNYCNLLIAINDDLEMKLISFSEMHEYLVNYKEPDYFNLKLLISESFIDFAIMELTKYDYDYSLIKSAIAYRELLIGFQFEWDNFYEKSDSASQEELRNFLKRHKDKTKEFILSINGFKERIDKQIEFFK